MVCLLKQGSQEGEAAVAEGPGTKLVARSCRLLSKRLQAVLVKDGARSEMFMCEATGGEDGAAVEVAGNKSRSVQNMIVIIMFSLPYFSLSTDDEMCCS